MRCRRDTENTHTIGAPDPAKHSEKGSSVIGSKRKPNKQPKPEGCCLRHSLLSLSSNTTTRPAHPERSEATSHTIMHLQSAPAANGRSMVPYVQLSAFRPVGATSADPGCETTRGVEAARNSTRLALLRAHTTAGGSNVPQLRSRRPLDRPVLAVEHLLRLIGRVGDPRRPGLQDGPRRDAGKQAPRYCILQSAPEVTTSRSSAADGRFIVPYLRLSASFCSSVR